MLAAVVAFVAAACNADTCTKCGACWDCTFGEDEDLKGGTILPSAMLEFSADDVRDAIEGVWLGKNTEIHVTRDDGEATEQFPIKFPVECKVPPDAANICAGLRVPAHIAGTIDGEPFESGRVEVAALHLDGAGVVPSSSDYKGLPFASDSSARVRIAFSPDGLWKFKYNDDRSELVATRQ
ncbi:MAG: hypothetical protein R3A78_08595 [Polyangiales bacterium]